MVDSAQDTSSLYLSLSLSVGGLAAEELSLSQQTLGCADTGSETSAGNFRFNEHASLGLNAQGTKLAILRDKVLAANIKLFAGISTSVNNLNLTDFITTGSAEIRPSEAGKRGKKET